MRCESDGIFFVLPQSGLMRCKVAIIQARMNHPLQVSPAVGDSYLCVSEALLHEKASVAVTQEAEVVAEGIVVDAAPVVVAHKSRYKQQQCALRLMEVGDHSFHDAIGEARGNH